VGNPSIDGVAVGVKEYDRVSSSPTAQPDRMFMDPGEGAQGERSPFVAKPDRWVLPKLAEHSGVGRHPIIDRHDQGWLLVRRAKATYEVLLLDHELQPLRRVALPLADNPCHSAVVAVDPAFRLVAVAHRSGLRLYTTEARLLWEVEHEPWYDWEHSACWFDREDRMWWISPQHSSVRLAVVAPHTGSSVASCLFDARSCGFWLVPHPTEPAVVVDGGAGQDGSFLWRAYLGSDGQLSIRAYQASTRIMGGFSTDGSRFVTAPHGDRAVAVHRWPDGRVVDILDGDAVFRREGRRTGMVDGFQYRASFVDDSHVLIDTHQRRLLLLAVHPLRVVAELWPAGYEVRGYGERGRPVSDPSLAWDYEGDLVDWVADGRHLFTELIGGRLCLWRLPELPSAFRDDDFQPVEQLHLPGTWKDERLGLQQAEFQ
jgi:hypothetical protein